MTIEQYLINLNNLIWHVCKICEENNKELETTIDERRLSNDT